MSEAVDAFARKAIDALVLLREYRGTESVGSLIKLLEALEEQYRRDLETVQPDRLIQLQTALRQVSALKRSILDPNVLDCKII